MSLLFNILPRFVIAFFFFKEQVLFNFMAAVIVHSNFGIQGNKISHYFHFFPIYLPWSDGTRCHDLSFLNVEFLRQLFPLFSFSFIKRLLILAYISFLDMILSIPLIDECLHRYVHILLMLQLTKMDPNISPDKLSFLMLFLSSQSITLTPSKSV